MLNIIKLLKLVHWLNFQSVRHWSEKPVRVIPKTNKHGI